MVSTSINCNSGHNTDAAICGSAIEGLTETLAKELDPEWNIKVSDADTNVSGGYG